MQHIPSDDPQVAYIEAIISISTLTNAFLKTFESALDIISLRSGLEQPAPKK